MSSAKILVIEDNTDELQGLMSLLRAGADGHPFLSRFEFIGVDSGERAIELISPEFQLVICDFHLGGPTTGGDVLKSWMLRYPETHFIMLTGERGVETIVDMMKHGATEYVTKPVDPVEFLTLINVTLNAATAS